MTTVSVLGEGVFQFWERGVSALGGEVSQRWVEGCFSSAGKGASALEAEVFLFCGEEGGVCGHLITEHSWKSQAFEQLRLWKLAGWLVGWLVGAG